MSKIELIKTDITQMPVDCIVNAANSALQEGGGVCGAIFAAAGSRELQTACNQYGGCQTGSAVITSGFKLKAKYIIHAVGPRWNGGKNGEEEDLYNCYQASLQLAMDNKCHSIAFPLISSGIFGYPKEEAWKVAIRSVKDFQQNNSQYSLDVAFAVISDNDYRLGMEILVNLTLEHQSVKGRFFHIVRFHKTNEENGYLSNWYMRDFTVDGKTYCCVEQYMMEQKALLFADMAIAQQIMQTSDPQTIKDLGRAVKNFNSAEWDGQKQLIVYRGVFEKFRQNPDLTGRLMTTGTALPVECSRTDKVWGVGLGMDDPDAANPNKWKGQNLLGYTIEAVRSDLMREMLQAYGEWKGN